MKLVTIFKIVFLSASMTLLAACQSGESTKKIGIIVPIEHKAMTEIVSGFEESIRQQYKKPVTFKVANAQGDMNLQRAIIQQMKSEHYDLLAPIGLAASEMTASMVHDQPVVSLASTYTDADRHKQKKCNLAVVHDEISPQQIVAFMHQTYPDLKEIALIHSASEKIFPDVEIAVNEGKKLGLTIKPRMVTTLNEIYSTVNSLPKTTQAILILKDNLIVSGISTLALSAEKRKIPLISSDQGSVQDGASFALGVHEKEIGVAGGQLAAAILSGKAACSLPIVNMDKLTIFANKNSLSKENLSLAPLEKVSKQRGFALELVDNTGK